MFNQHKAGLENVDKDLIDRVIEDCSRGTPFWENQQRKNARHQEQIRKVLEKLGSASTQEWKKAQSEADEFLEQLELELNTDRVMVHIDMDAFYASVEERDDSTLAEKPMAVGCVSMISTSNYVARRFGIRAGLPGFIGLKLCPQLILIPPDLDKYTAASEAVIEVLSRYDSNLTQIGLDEAVLDITHLCLTSENTPEQIVSSIRAEVENVTRLTCSAGIGPNRLVAKIFADVNKPNGQFRLDTAESVEMYFQAMSVRKIIGIGQVQEKILSALNIVKCSDFIENRAKVFMLFSEATAKFYLAAAKGVWHDNVIDSEVSLRSRRSKSAETTFRDSDDAVFLVDVCQQLAEKLSQHLLLSNLKGKRITVKFKTSSFDVFSRSVTLESATSSKSTIAENSIRILRNTLNSSPALKFRLLGVKVSNFVNFENTRSKQATLSQHFRLPSAAKSSFPMNEIEFSPSEAVHSPPDARIIDCTSAASNSSENLSDDDFNEIHENSKSAPSTSCTRSTGPVGAGSASTSKLELSKQELLDETYCPVCAVIMNNISIADLNRHVNQCMNREQQREMRERKKSYSGDLKANSKLRKTKAVKRSSANESATNSRRANTKSITNFFNK